MTNSLKDITLLVFDEREHFNNPTTQLRLGNDLFNKVVLVESKSDFDKEYESLDPLEKFVLICHVFHAGNDNNIPLRGFIRFNSTGIEDKYKVAPILVSAGDSGNVMKALYENENVRLPVYLYSTMRDHIKQDRIKVYTKSDLDSASAEPINLLTNRNAINVSQFDYAIITALYRDEFEQLRSYFEWTPQSDFVTATKKYQAGYLKGHPEKKVIVGIPAATGMVDTSIIATEMLHLFRPKYLFMSGVCGGKKDLEFGDIVVASKVFTFQKGKISDIVDENGKRIKLYDENKEEVNYECLYDRAGNQIQVTVEKFEVEQDSIMEIDPLVKDNLEGVIESIKTSINNEIEAYGKEIDVHFEPMACSTMVINKQNFFEDHIKVVDRKVVAVEMESYGVARATRFANNGQTKWVIFKAVMDNMSFKDDKAKKFAAKTSALFLKELLQRNIL